MFIFSGATVSVSNSGIHSSIAACHGDTGYAQGGGIFTLSELSIHHSTVFGNTAESSSPSVIEGGGLYCDGYVQSWNNNSIVVPSITLRNTNINNNRACGATSRLFGAGIIVDGKCRAMLSSCVVSDNFMVGDDTTRTYGTAIAVFGFLNATDTRIEGHIAPPGGLGSALYSTATVPQSTSITLQNCILTNNSAQQPSGTVFVIGPVAINVSGGMMSLPLSKSANSLGIVINIRPLQINLESGWSRCMPGAITRAVLASAERILSESIQSAPNFNPDVFLNGTDTLYSYRSNCEPCLKGTYNMSVIQGGDSLDLSQACSTCPFGAVCHGSANVSALPGFWGWRHTYGRYAW